MCVPTCDSVDHRLTYFVCPCFEDGFAIESDGVGTDQPVINNMQCAGSEARLVDCQHTTATCPTSPVAGVTCFSGEWSCKCMASIL